MTNKPRKIGTQFTSDVIAYLRTDGFPHAELRNQAGVNDLGDIVGLRGSDRMGPGERANLARRERRKAGKEATS